MEITINDQRKIFAVQKEFMDVFPNLKLEFYSKSNRGGGAPSKKIMKHIGKTIAELRTMHSSGNLTLHPHMTVGELQQSFRDVFGLSTEVFRKSGNNWVETTDTNDWTLEKQNLQGSEANKVEKVL